MEKNQEQLQYAIIDCINAILCIYILMFTNCYKRRVQLDKNRENERKPGGTTLMPAQLNEYSHARCHFS